MLNKFLQSGIIERYCINDVSLKEREEVEAMSEKFETVRNEIAFFKKNLSLSTENISPSLSNVKIRLMRQVYQSVAKTNFTFVPLMNTAFSSEDVEKVIHQHNLKPSQAFDGNIKITVLPSTVEVENAAVWIKSIIREETHTKENEYIYIVKGSCVMCFDGINKTYQQGEVIFIPPHVKHSAKIISIEPMFALVQRQLLAQ